MLTIADLLAPGGPLAMSELLAGAGAIDNGVTWAVLLRPYYPAIPPLKGGEIALVGTDVLARFDPPVSIADVIIQLGRHGASGLAVRGKVNAQGISEAERWGLPLIRLSNEALLHDVEQQIMRECAMFQARQEMRTGEKKGAWIGRLLSGQVMTFSEVQGPARHEGYILSARYSVALVRPNDRSAEGKHNFDRLAATWLKQSHNREEAIIAYSYEGSMALMVPASCDVELATVVHDRNLACGWGSEKALLDAHASLEEARYAILSSTLLHDGNLMRYRDLGADRILLLLYTHNKAYLDSFVEDTLGPLLKHDTKTATPLLPTMSSFVGHGGRLRETAADIYVHRNTLAYRLDRAAEILGVDLRDAEARLAVEMALRALPLVRGNAAS